jgi:glycosyltransferase involved in cell wall biosynthesis
MRRIAHLLSTPLENHGGLNLLVREIAKGLSDYYTTSVFCPKLENNIVEPDIPHPGYSHLPWNNTPSGEETLEHLKRMIHEHGIELIFFHGGDFSWGPDAGHISLVNKIARLGNKCVYVNHQSTPLFSRLPTLGQHGSISSIRSSIRFSLSWLLKCYQLSKTNVEITVSDFEETQTKRRYFPWKEKIVRIYHSRLPSSSWTKLRDSKKEKIILSVGHFAYRKGQHVLIKAFGRIATKYPSWKIRLVGSSGKGEYLHHLYDLIEKYDIQSQTELITETANPDRFFETASIYVQPSIVEAYGLALQEAMFFGCACVGSDSGGIRDSILNQNYLFPPDDEVGLSIILERLASSDSLIQHRQEVATTDSMKFNRNRDQMLIDYRHIIEKCFKGNA